MATRITSKTTLETVRSMLRSDGYSDLVDRAGEIRAAARTGCLVWTRERLTTTDRSRIDARPKEVA